MAPTTSDAPHLSCDTLPRGTTFVSLEDLWERVSHILSGLPGVLSGPNGSMATAAFAAIHPSTSPIGRNE